MIKVEIKKLEKSQVEIIGILPSEDFTKYEDKALEKINERIELPGFRKGKAPVDMIKKNVPEIEILEQMAENALFDNYVKILEENKIDAIGRPEIQITKIGKGSDLEFKIVTAVLPELDLPDYKKISKEENKKNENKKEVVVSEEDVTKVINDLRKMRAEQARPAHEHKEGETEEEHKAHHEEIPEEKWPEFNDEFAKSFGNFQTKEELAEKIKTNIKTEKETEQKDKTRLAIIEEVVKQTKGEIPEILINSEIEKILYKLESDITGVGFKFEDYLKQINKSIEDLKNEFRADAEKRAKLQMIIHKIADIENIKPTEEEIEKDVNQITAMYKDADPSRAKAYVEQMLENEKVLNFLEQQ